MDERETASRTMMQFTRRLQVLLQDAEYTGLIDAFAAHVGHMPPGHAQALLGVTAQLSTALERVAADTVPAKRPQKFANGRPLLHRPWCPLCAEP
jgi:hypothetical protein